MTGVAKALSELTNPVIGKTGHHLKNSKELLEKIEDIKLTEEEVWMSHDVVGFSLVYQWGRHWKSLNTT